MIKILKSGAWALGGTQIVDLVEGDEKSFGPADDFALVEAGRAEWVKVKAKAEEAPTSDADVAAGDIASAKPAFKKAK